MEPFSELEKRQLLTEIIKHSQISNQQLIMIIGWFSLAPNWFHLTLPNGRTVAQCQAAYVAMGNEASALGMKRKAPGDEPNSQGNNGVQVSASQVPRTQSQPTAAPNIQMNAQHPSAVLMNSQPYQQQSGPPPKKKGRPAYAGRNAIGQRPFNPRPLAPMPSHQLAQIAQSSFRPIAPAPQLYPNEIMVIDSVVSSGQGQGLVYAPNAQQQQQQQQGGMSIGNMLTRRTVEELTRQRCEQQRLLAASQAPGQAANRPRSNSEAVPSAPKQEATEQDRSRSVEPLETKNQSGADEKNGSDQAKGKENSSPDQNKGLRRSQRKA
ncbi:hypothetical protein FLONG3_10471 [Fusarium longipes]|uniref:Uncharacterized protein n=1 Tax=Fusarium longipes TaxID=694270 RepID=A0A395RN24_9HYPO|nr:hypothetical protein FLONG3_10471 [Fusarium longipes]